MVQWVFQAEGAAWPMAVKGKSKVCSRRCKSVCRDDAEVEVGGLRGARSGARGHSFSLRATAFTRGGMKWPKVESTQGRQAS